MINSKFIDVFLERFSKEKHKKMLTIYISSLKNHVDVCQSIFSEQTDFNKLQGSAHDLKSIFRTLGVENVGDLAEEIETAIKEEGNEQIVENMALLIKYVNETIEMLTTRIGGLD